MLETAPFHPDPARDGGGAPLTPGSAVWAAAGDGVRLRLAYWPCKDARGGVLLFPGRTESIEKYGVTASALAAEGFATLAIDWRGQGLSDRLLPDRGIGHVGRFSDYQRDVAAMIETADQLGLPGPRYLIGHSMGGAIGLRAALDGLPVRAAVFTGPMWGIAMPPPARAAAWAVTALRHLPAIGKRIIPTTRPVPYVLSAPFEGNQLTTDPSMYEMMREQARLYPEMNIGGPSINWLGEALREIAALRAAAPVDLPVLTVIGGNERIVDIAAVRDRMARWPGGRTITLDGAEHEVLMETPARRKQIIDAAVALFSGHR